jgi:hypothetical protein
MTPQSASGDRIAHLLTVLKSYCDDGGYLGPCEVRDLLAAYDEMAEELRRATDWPTGVLHDILEKAGCVSVTKADYEEAKTLRTQLAAANELKDLAIADFDRAMKQLAAVNDKVGRAADVIREGISLSLDSVSVSEDDAWRSKADLWLAALNGEGKTL